MLNPVTVPILTGLAVLAALAVMLFITAALVHSEAPWPAQTGGRHRPENITTPFRIDQAAAGELARA